MNANKKVPFLALTVATTLFSCLNASAQSTQVQGSVAWADQDSGAQACNFSQPRRGGCSGTWDITWARGTGKISGVANYGTLKGKELSTVTSQGTETIDTNAIITSSFNDVLSFPNLPNGMSAVLSATVDLQGSSFIGNYPSYASGEATVTFGNDASQCKVEGGGPGECTAALTVVGGAGSVSFQLTLNLVAFADDPSCTCYEYNMAEDLGYQAKITSLTLIDSDGQAYKIVTASHHHYPAR